VSSQSRFAIDSHLTVWVMINTSTLQTVSPNLQLLSITIPIQTYSFLDVANQRSGPTLLGTSIGVPLEFLDGNDSWVLTVSYVGGRLYVTLATVVVDGNGWQRVGGAYFILSPTVRSGALSAPVLRQGLLTVDGNHILRPVIAVNAQGNGAI